MNLKLEVLDLKRESVRQYLSKIYLNLYHTPRLYETNHFRINSYVPLNDVLMSFIIS